jgi:hypothetical protein
MWLEIVKMKKIIILFYLIVTTHSYSQDFENCVDSLYSQSFLTRLFAVECINDLKIYNALDALGELLENQPPYLQVQFLNALYTLEDPKIRTRAHELIERADGFDEDPEHPYDPLEAKVFATTILVYIGDFSTVNYAFEKLNQDEITTDDALAFHLLPYIMDQVPSYKDEAKNILLGLLNNDDEYFRYYALLYLAEEFGKEMNSELVNKLVNDNDLPTRFLALEYLFKQKYAGLNSLLKTQLIQDRTGVFRITIADSLLQKFGEPSDLKAVIDYQPNEPDETARSLMGYAIEDFIPPKPDTLNWQGMTTKLLSYTNELLEYSWIKNEERQDYYIQKLIVVNEALLKNESEEACAIINEQILPKAEQDLKGGLITAEGDKFLHYYTIYIKEEIEKEFGSCQ